MTKQFIVRIINPSKLSVPFSVSILCLQQLKFIYSLQPSPGSPALLKGQCMKSITYDKGRLQYDQVGLYVHEVQPCTSRAWQESRLFLVQLCGFQLSFPTHTPERHIYITKNDKFTKHVMIIWQMQRSGGHAWE